MCKFDHSLKYVMFEIWKSYSDLVNKVFTNLFAFRQYETHYTGVYISPIMTHVFSK